MKTSRNVAIVVAAGQGKRFDSQLPKQFCDLGGKPMVVHCLLTFEKSEFIDEIVLVVPDDYLAYASQAIIDDYDLKKINKIICGGKTRQESVFSGLSSCSSGINLAIIHDGDRPFLNNTLLNKVIGKAGEIGAAILAVPSRESIKLGENGKILKSINRNTVWIAQTPQVFLFDKINEAHRRAEAADNKASDDSQLYEQYFGEVGLVMGSYDNIKITTPEDFILAHEILKKL